MKYILLNKIYIKLQQFQVIPENKTQGNLIKYLMLMIKKMIKIKKQNCEEMPQMDKSTGSF